MHLSKEGKSIFCHRLAKLLRRALTKDARGKGTSVHPTPTILVPVLATDAQSLKRDHRSAEKHLKNNTKKFQTLQPVSQLH